MSLISVAERKLFATDEKYHEIVGSERMKFKVIKPQAVGEYLRDRRKENGESLIIELRALRINKKKEFSHKLTMAKDRDHDLVYGVFTGLDRFGNATWHKVFLDREQIVINLNSMMEMKEFAVIAMHPSIKGSPFEDLSDPIMYVFDPKEESKEHLNKLELIPLVTTFINELKGKKLVMFARYMGLPVSMDTDEVMLKGSLAKMGIADPLSFINKTKARNRHYEEILKNAIEVGAILEDPQKGYMHSGVYIGSSHEEIIDRMKNEREFVNTLLFSIEQLDTVVNMFEAEVIEEVVTVPLAEKQKAKEKEKENITTEKIVTIPGSSETVTGISAEDLFDGKKSEDVLKFD